MIVPTFTANEPPLGEARPGHVVACHFWKEIAAGLAPRKSVNVGGVSTGA